MKKSLNDLVRAEAVKNVGQYNFAKNREQKILHHNICKQLVELADKHHFPITVLVYIAVGTNAHRMYVFERGYQTIKVQKAERIIALCDIFAKKFGENTRTNDKLVHAVSRYVDICGGGVLKFKQLVNALDVDALNMRKIKTAKDLAKILCGKEAEYSKGGYIVTINKPTRHTK